MASDPAPTSVPPASSGSRSAAQRFPALLTLLDSIQVLLTIALSVILGMFAVRNSDFWRHLAGGRHLLTTGEFGTDPFSLAGLTEVWVNHAWLFDTLLYGLYSAFLEWVVVLKGLFLGAIVILLFQVRRGQSWWPYSVTIAIGFLAAAPMFELRSQLASMLWTTILVLLLVRGERWTGYRLPIAVGLLAWLWASSDSWFVLGPVLVASWGLGHFLHARLTGTTDGPSSKILCRTLIACLVGATLTPHHFRVWQLPVGLFQTEAAELLLYDPNFAGLFLSPFSDGFLESPEVVNRINALAFAFLFLSSCAVLIGNFRMLNWGHLGLFLSTALAALLNIQAIPFFVCVAAPLTAWYLDDYCTRVKAERTEPRWVQRFVVGSVVGRILTFFALIVATLTAWPGWLSPAADYPEIARRVDIRIVVDKAQQRCAEQLNAWRIGKNLPESMHGLPLNPQLGDYCMWFAPNERSFIDSRFRLHDSRITTWGKLRQTIREFSVTNRDELPEDGRELFRREGIGYVILSVSEGDRLHAELRKFWLRSRDWPTWYLDGRNVIVGSRAANEQVAEALRFDPFPRAYGPNPVRVPPAERALRLPPSRDFLAQVLSPLPERPFETDEALMLLDFAKHEAEEQIRFVLALRCGHEFLAGTNLRAGWMDFITVREIPRLRVTGRIQAILLTALRLARTATILEADHPDAYFILSEIYFWANIDPFDLTPNPDPATNSLVRSIRLLVGLPLWDEWRKEQAVTCLQRGLARAPTPPEMARPPRAIDAYARRRLPLPYYADQMNNYCLRDLGAFDIARDYRALALDYLMYLTDDEFGAARRKASQQSISAVRWPNPRAQGKTPLEKPENLLPKLLADYELAKPSKEEDIVQIGLQNGLLGRVLTDLGKLTPNDRSRELMTLQFAVPRTLALGRLEATVSGLQRIDELQSLVGNVPNPGANLGDIRFKIALLSGDYESAGRLLQDILRRLERVVPPLPMEQMTIDWNLAANPFFQIFGREVDPFGPVFRTIFLHSIADRRLFVLRRECEYHMQRGIIALEAGDNEAAANHFEAALSPLGISLHHPQAQLPAFEYLPRLKKK